jgi:hypothetical protein
MSKSARWTWVVAMLAVTGTVLVLAFVLTLGSDPGGLHERNFVWLFWANVTVAALLALVIGIAAVR